MRKIALLSTSLAVMLVALLPATPAQAIPRTWVSSTGMGTDCTRAAPCSLFQTAHNATDPGGEINCADAGSFGGLVIDRSITIDCTGMFGGILSIGASGGVTINAPNVVVILRGLTIDGTFYIGTSIGVSFVNGAVLHIENCRISGFRGDPGHGVKFAPPTGVSSRLFVSDSVITDNGLPSSGGGIIIQTAGTATVLAMLDRVRVNNNTYGIFANGIGGTASMSVHIRDSVAAGNTFHGITASTAAGQSPTSVTVDRSSSLLNSTGIRAEGSLAFILLGNSTVISNLTGLSSASGGNIFSYQNNQLSGNFTDGAPTAVLMVR